MKYPVIILCLVLGVILGLLSGCSEPASLEPIKSVNRYSVVCLNGVQYYQAGWSLAPKYSPRSSTPDTCS